jgi:hypothetical protein
MLDHQVARHAVKARHSFIHVTPVAEAHTSNAYPFQTPPTPQIDKLTLRQSFGPVANVFGADPPVDQVKLVWHTSSVATCLESADCNDVVSLPFPRLYNRRPYLFILHPSSRCTFTTS